MPVDIVIAATLGLLVGSFANVVVYRVPRGESIVTPPSACPACGSRIKPYDNSPVVSWLVLKGKCRACGANISARYPLVEIGMAGLFSIFALRIGLVWVLPAYLVFAFVTLVLLLIDLDSKRLPNAVLVPGGAAASVLLLTGAFLDGQSSEVPRALIAGAVYFGLMFAIAVASRGGMGMGDVKLAAVLGLFTGYLSWAVFSGGVIFGFILGGLTGLVLLLSGLKDRQDQVPFGPALITGSWIAIVTFPLAGGVICAVE